LTWSDGSTPLRVGPKANGSGLRPARLKGLRDCPPLRRVKCGWRQRFALAPPTSTSPRDPWLGGSLRRRSNRSEDKVQPARPWPTGRKTASAHKSWGRFDLGQHPGYLIAVARIQEAAPRKKRNVIGADRGERWSAGREMLANRDVFLAESPWPNLRQARAAERGRGRAGLRAPTLGSDGTGWPSGRIPGGEGTQPRLAGQECGYILRA